MIHIHTITIIFALLFLIVFIYDRRNIINGFLFSIFLFSCYMSLAFETVINQNNLILPIFITVTIIGVLFSLFYSLLLMVFCFSNARILFKKEGKSLRNSLTLLLGILILCLSLLNFFNLERFIPTEWSFIFQFSSFAVYYFLFFFAGFFISSCLYQVYFPKYDKDFIIVLGSGLIDGYIVPPLLQSRIDKAISFYDKQLEKSNKQAIIIFSGGQGRDEKLSEASAMSKYALSKGVPKEAIILEDKSVNTLENMSLSKKLWTICYRMGINLYTLQIASTYCVLEYMPKRSD